MQHYVFPEDKPEGDLVLFWNRHDWEFIDPDSLVDGDIFSYGEPGPSPETLARAKKARGEG